MDYNKTIIKGMENHKRIHPNTFYLRIHFALGWSTWVLSFKSTSECEKCIKDLDLDNDATVARYDVI